MPCSGRGRSSWKLPRVAGDVRGKDERKGRDGIGAVNGNADGRGREGKEMMWKYVKNLGKEEINALRELDAYAQKIKWRTRYEDGVENHMVEEAYCFALGPKDFAAHLGGASALFNKWLAETIQKEDSSRATDRLGSRVPPFARTGRRIGEKRILEQRRRRLGGRLRRGFRPPAPVPRLLRGLLDDFPVAPTSNGHICWRSLLATRLSQALSVGQPLSSATHGVFATMPIARHALPEAWNGLRHFATWSTKLITRSFKSKSSGSRAIPDRGRVKPRASEVLRVHRPKRKFLRGTPVRYCARCPRPDCAAA